MGNKSTFWRKFNLFISWVSLISGIGSIISFGVSIYSWVKDFNITSTLIIWIIEYFAYAPLLCCISCLIMHQFVIPKYKVDKQDVPPEEAKPSCAITIILSICIILCIAYIIIVPDINYASSTIEEEQQTNETDEDSYEPYIEINIYTEENNLTPFQQTVEEYIIKSYKEPVSIDEWRILSDDALYYIRNGIFAYSHAKFDKDFYSVYSWYDGTIDINNFDWNVFNSYQRINIENISAVENERKQQ